MMNKKHYKEFANACALIDDNSIREEVINVIVTVCLADNYRFSIDKFKEWIRRVRANESLVGLR